jgi:hypothetical protein
MKECSTPPSEAVQWDVRCRTIRPNGEPYWTRLGVYTAQTAFEAHRQCVMAPGYGSCRVTRYVPEGENSPPAQYNPAKNGCKTGDITMNQQIKSSHRIDENGNPTGGRTTGVGIDIEWQDGPLGRGDERKDPNGAFVEGVIEAAADRLRFYQSGKFACRENALALTKLEEALHWCQHRTAAREARAVEGTHNV